MITDILLLNDANKNAKNKLGKSPLDLAIEEGNLILNSITQNH